MINSSILHVSYIAQMISLCLTNVPPGLRIQMSVPGPEVIKLEYSLKLKIKRIDWLLVDTCPQAANHSALFSVLLTEVL